MKLRQISSLLFLACLALLVATPAMAIPTCEVDCSERTPCDQVCWSQNGFYSTCASYICDEPQFPWPVAELACDVAVDKAVELPSQEVETQSDVSEEVAEN